jgi:hypothetical protein
MRARSTATLIALFCFVLAAPVVLAYTVTPLATGFSYFENFGGRTDEPNQGFNHGVVAISANCDQHNTSTITMSASGVVDPNRTYPGPFTWTAVVTLSPHQFDANGDVIEQSAHVMSVAATFEVNGPNGKVSGTESFQGPILGFPVALGFCGKVPNLFDPNELVDRQYADAGLWYDVVIETPGGCAHETGTSLFSVNRYVSIGEGDIKNWSNQFLAHDPYGGSQEPIACPPPPGPVDADGDGTEDSIDADGGTGSSPAGAFNDDTGNGFQSSGEIADSGGLSVSIADAPDPDGVTITAGPGSGTVNMSVCGGFTVLVDAGSSAVVTCGSVTTRVISGTAHIVLGNGLTVVNIPADGIAKVATSAAGGYSVANLGATALTIAVDGTSSTLAAGTQSSLQTWHFVGFSQPVDNGGVLNRMKAGQTVPIRWRLLDAANHPVANLATAKLSVADLSCAAIPTADQVEELSAGASGLLNLGNGNYQLNWTSPKAYANSCKTLRLSVGDGVTHNAAFNFVK